MNGAVDSLAKATEPLLKSLRDNTRRIRSALPINGAVDSLAKATEPLLKSLRDNTRRIIEVVITGEQAKKTRCVVFAKRVTKITRNEAKLLGAHFDYIFGRARVLKTDGFDNFPK